MLGYHDTRLWRSFWRRAKGEERPSEPLAQLSEAPYFQQAAIANLRSHLAALQLPRVMVRHEDRVQTGGERGIDVRLGAVADHPRLLAQQRVLLDDRGVGGGVLLGDHFSRHEMLLQAGALQLAGLFGDVALGEQEKMVAPGQFGEGLGYLR